MVFYAIINNDFVVRSFMENEKLLNLKNSALKEVEEANRVDSLNAVRNT